MYANASVCSSACTALVLLGRGQPNPHACLPSFFTDRTVCGTRILISYYGYITFVKTITRSFWLVAGVTGLFLREKQAALAGG
jgi:hypothetical protein